MQSRPSLSLAPECNLPADSRESSGRQPAMRVGAPSPALYIIGYIVDGCRARPARAAKDAAGGAARCRLLTRATDWDCSGLPTLEPIFAEPIAHMADTRLSIRIDLKSGDRIGPGKIALLEAIRETGSISAAARHLGMSYRRAWLLVEEVNDALEEPAVAAATGGRQGGGAVLTRAGERIVDLYRSIETTAHASAREQFRAVGRLLRKDKKVRA